MYVSPAIVTLLSLGLANTAAAVPVRSTPHGHQNPQAVLAARAYPAAQDNLVQHLAARDQLPEAVHKALKQLNTRQNDVMKLASTVVARYSHMPQSDERTRLVVRDLERRGILDQLISSLKELVDTLLGQRVSQPPSKRQAGNVGSVVQEILCLLEQLLGNGTDQCNAADDDTPTSSAGAKQSKQTKGSSKISASNSTSVDDDAPSTPSLVPEDQMTSSATASATASASSASATTSEKKQKNADKGDTTKQAAATSSAGSSDSATGSDSASSNSTSTDSSAQNATASIDGPSSARATLARQTNTQHERRDVMDLMPRQSGVTGLLTVLRMLLDALLNTLLPMSTRSEAPSSSASAQSAVATGKDCPPPGTPNDGMYRPGCPGYGRRDLDERDTIGDLLDTVMPIVESLISALTSQDAGASSAAGGASKSAATNTEDSEPTSSSASKNKTQSSSTGASSDDASSSSDSSSSSSSTASLLTSLLSARDFLEADGFAHGVSNMQARSVNEVVELAGNMLTRRADLKPVWSELKKIGDEEWKSAAPAAGSKKQRRDAGSDFAPVWSAFSDMIDDALNKSGKDDGAAQRASAGVKARRGLPSADKSRALAQAGFKWATKQLFTLGNSSKSRRGTEEQRLIARKQHDWKPLANAAGSFAQQQMREWTGALNRMNANKQH